MTSSKQELLDLANRVEAGEVKDQDVWIHLPCAVNGVIQPVLTSLDAAKALHDAVLPGFKVKIHELSTGYFGVRVTNVDWVYCMGRGGRSGSPAAAWVAAILRAKASEVSE